LYASDGRAVQELLKVAALLYKAVQSKNKKPEDEKVPAPVKVQDVKTARTLASEITHSGAKLFDLLATESIDKQERARALRFIDVAATAAEGSREQQIFERSLRDNVETTNQSLDSVRLVPLLAAGF
jgi:siderophore synthetase component